MEQKFLKFAGYLNIFAGCKLAEIIKQKKQQSLQRCFKKKIDKIEHAVYFQYTTANLKSYWQSWKAINFVIKYFNSSSSKEDFSRQIKDWKCFFPIKTILCKNLCLKCQWHLLNEVQHKHLSTACPRGQPRDTQGLRKIS